MRAGEAAILRASDNRMQTVAEFMKQCLHVLVCHQRRLVRTRWREIEKQRYYRPLVFSVWQQFATYDLELSEVIEFPFTREHIELEKPKRFTRRGIAHYIKLHVIDPFERHRDVFKFQPENALVNVEHPVEHLLEWEIGAQRFFIDSVFPLISL